MNVERLVIGWLASQLQVPVHGDVPADRPAFFVTVERTGGESGRVCYDYPVVAVQCWAPTREQAADLMEEVDVAMRAMPALNPVSKVTRNTYYNFPTSHGEPRYQGVYELVVG